MRSFLVFLVILHAASSSLVVAPAKAQAPDRPRVGVVLGGGGARGGAQIGVLRTLEELRVPVDFIAGTSIGAVIAGAYASGMSLDDLEALLEDVDWGELFRGAPARRDLTFRRKQDSRSSIIEFELGFDGGSFQLPGGLIGGHGLNLLVKAVTLPVAEVRNFDRLPVPFRSMAADLVTGELVVLGEGRLSQAILASMAMPGAFEPVEIDGRLLVDGGILRNIPVDVVREMGADVVIAVDVSSPLAPPESLRSAPGVALQVTTLVVQANSERSRGELGPSDILIRPELGDIAVASFDQMMAAVPIGEEAARGEEEALRNLSLTPEAYEPYTRRVIPRERSVRVDFVEIDNETRLSDAVLEGLLDLEAGETLALEELRDRLTVLQGVGEFQQVDFELLHRGAETGILVRPQEKPWGPNYFRFGIAIRDNIESLSTFNILTRFTATRLNRRGGEIRADVQIGETRRFAAEWYQPLDNRLALFGLLRGEHTSQLDAVFEGDAAFAQYRTRSGGGRLMGGSRLGLWGQLEAGLSWEHVKVTPTVGSSDLPTLEDDVASVIARFAVDDIDNTRFPSRGLAAVVDAKLADEFLGGDVAFRKLSTTVSPAFTTGRNSVVLKASAGTSFGTDLPAYERFELGGFLSLSGLQRRQITGDYLGFGALIYHRLMSRPRGLAPFGGLRVGGSLETGNAWRTTAEIAADNLRFSASVFVGLDTLVGPLYTAYGLADGGSGSWYFFLGHVF
jgi:NTE family protein